MAELILPKGIVINTTWIYDEVAKQPVVPPEAIKKYWKVYTTTFHRLVDPTANRLENFWWHVWGSDRRHLPGPVLARLFEEISNGPTFVKLRGPPNRYEPPSQPSSPTQSPVQPSSSQTIPKISKAKQGDPELRVEKKTVAPSSSKKTPGKPILKKPRGPSASGPRPKTRFASPPPPGSDAEDGGSRDSEAASSASTAVASGGESKVSGGPSAKEPRKKTTTAGVPKKKGPTFVASAASRRRPAMPRRQSSQSATGGSEVTSRETGKSVKKEVSPEQTPEAEPKLSAKAAGKRPARQVAPAAPSATAAPAVTESSSSSGHGTVTTGKAQDPPTMIQTKRTPGQQPKPTEDKMVDESTKVEVDQVKATKPKPHARDDVQERARPETAPSETHSPQVTGAPRRGSGGVTRGHRVLNTLTSSSTAQTSKATAQGTIIEFDENLPTKQLREQAMNFQHEHGTPGSSSSKPLDPRFTPTPPSAVPAVPLGRSKSQLTLLLERQAEKKDKKPRR